MDDKHRDARPRGALTQPHAAYAAYVNGERHRPTFLQRAMPDIGKFFEPLRDAVRITLAPALLGRQLSDLHMQQMRLPAREGGLSLDDGSEDAPRKHSDSRECTEQLMHLIVESVSKLLSPKNNRDAGIGKLVQKRNAERLAKEADAVQARLRPRLARNGRWRVLA